MSSLYFRGKLAYARAVVERRGPGAASFVITPTRGLLPPNTMASTALLEEFAATDIAAGDTRYRAPLERDLAALAGRLAADARVVLLGSIASDKYVDVLVAGARRPAALSAGVRRPRRHEPRRPAAAERGQRRRARLRAAHVAVAAARRPPATARPAAARRDVTLTASGR